MPDALLCAVCLDDEKRPTEEIRKAITIANGQAVCPLHFVAIRDSISETRGQFALVMYGYP